MDLKDALGTKVITLDDMGLSIAPGESEEEIDELLKRFRKYNDALEELRQTHLRRESRLNHPESEDYQDLATTPVVVDKLYGILSRNLRKCPLIRHEARICLPATRKIFRERPHVKFDLLFSTHKLNWQESQINFLLSV